MVSHKPFLGVIQFMHPGAEHKVGKDDWTAWNRTTHRRKFMSTFGTSLGDENQVQESDLLFWGEWEAPSRRVHSWDRQGNLPENLVIPRFPGSAIPAEGLQNTDPYVFGDSFKYTLCKQSKRTGKETFLANLAPGTLILFGSKVQNLFVLDTAFVVDNDPISHSSHNWERELSHMSAVYRAVTLEPMYWDVNTKPETTFKLYTGARIENPINGMYSFFPCIHETNIPMRFERPVIEVPGITNHALMMGEKRTVMSLPEIEMIWQLVASQVKNQGLRLGLSAREPEKSQVPDYLWPH
jgi:hypothetical protein